MRHSTCFLFILVFFFQPIFARKDHYRLLVGTYTTTGNSQGIYAFDLNLSKKMIKQKFLKQGIINPSFLAMSPDKKFVYAVSENGTASSIHAFSFNHKTDKLSLIDTCSTKGSDPCFVSLTSNHVLTANYSGGNLSVFERKKDGSLSDVVQQMKHIGRSINPARQEASHVHQVVFSPDKNYVLTNDLGLDKVYVYQYHPLENPNVLTAFDSISVKQGSGPRHLAFSNDGKKIYLLQELDGTLSVLSFKNGKLSIVQETSVVQNGSLTASAADIHLSADGRFLYASNRGPSNTISCYSIDPDGRIRFIQQIASDGDGPRNFALSPDGKYLLAGNQNSDKIAIFSRNRKTGTLQNTGIRVDVPSPVCLIFY